MATMIPIAQRKRRLAPSVGESPIDPIVSMFVKRCRRVMAQLPALDADGRFDAVLDTLREAPAATGSGAGRPLVAALVAELANRLLDEARDRTPARLDHMALARPLGGGRERYVERALEVLAERYADHDLTLARVSEAVGVSRWHLSRLLRHAAGRGFHELLAATRVREAKLLLLETALSVKEIAAGTGYDHVSHFDRQFRRLTGLTPRLYRAVWRAAGHPPSARAPVAASGP